LVRLTYREKLLLPISCRRPHRLHRVTRSKLTSFLFLTFFRRTSALIIAKVHEKPYLYNFFIKHDNARIALSEITRWTDPKHSHKCISYRASCFLSR